MITKRISFLFVFFACSHLLFAASISGPTTLLVGCTATYTVSGCTGGPIFWSGPSAMQILSGGNGSSYITVKFNSAGSFGIFAGGGCSTSFNMTVYDSPSIIGPSTVCYGSTSVFTASSGFSSLSSWSVNIQVNNLVVSGNTLTVTWASNTQANAVISVTYNTSSCGVFTLTKPITIQTYYGGTITGTTPASSGFSYPYSISGSNRTWSVTGGTLIDPQGSEPMRIKWNCNIASGTVNVQYTSMEGCIRSATLNVPLTPVMPTLTPTDAYPANEYCYKASRIFATELGYPSYVWTISGQSEEYSGSVITRTYTKTGTDRNTFNTKLMPDGTTNNFYGTVTIKVRYDMGGGCNSSEKSQVMNVTPATISFRGSTSAVPIVCYSDSQNIGSYSTDAGFSSYAWSAPTVTNVGQGVATASAQSTNVNWTTSGGGSGGFIPIIVTYFKSSLNCTNTNLARNGVNMRRPSMSGPSPVSVGQISYYSTNFDGYEYSWNISPTVAPNYGRFTDQFGTTIPAPNNNATYITWDRNNEPDPFPTVSANYWIYYPQVGGTRLSYCTGANNIVDIRGCTTCTNRIAPDSPSVNDTDEAIEPNILGAYPTPADNELWVRNVPVGANIKMISMSGVETINTTQDQENLIKKLETGDLTSGVYLLRTVDLDKQPVVFRVVIKH